MRYNFSYYAITSIMVILIGILLYGAVGEMPPYGASDNPAHNEVYQRYVTKGPQESFGFNLVSNILLDYRAYDTLLETTVLFTVVIGIILMWEAGRKEKL